MIYIVSEEGVYRHDVFGPWTDFDAAKAKAETLSNAGDGYHDYAVLRASPQDPALFVELGRWVRNSTRWQGPRSPATWREAA